MRYCIAGHAKDVKNGYLDPRGKLQCRICRSKGVRDWYDKKGRKQQDRKKRLVGMDLFHDNYIVNKNGCWLWKRSLNEDGYGTFRGIKAHRYAYRELRGPLVAGLEIDHLCRERSCVNPDHLEQITHAENIKRGDYTNARKIWGDMQKNKKHCPQGHKYIGRNLVIEKRTDGGLARRCRICACEKTKRYLLKLSTQTL